MEAGQLLNLHGGYFEAGTIVEWGPRDGAAINILGILSTEATLPLIVYNGGKVTINSIGNTYQIGINVAPTGGLLSIDDHFVTGGWTPNAYATILTTGDTLEIGNLKIDPDGSVLGSVDMKFLTGTQGLFQNVALTALASGQIPYRSIPAEKLTDGAMELWDDASTLTNWTRQALGTSTLNRDGADKHGGTYSARIDVDSSNSVIYIFQTVTLSATGMYKVSLWYKTDAGKTMLVEIKNSGDNFFLSSDKTWESAETYLTLPTATTWTEYVFYFQAHPSYTSYIMEFIRGAGCASSSFWVDDVSLIEAGALADSPLSTDGTDVDNSGVYKVDGVQVIGAQGAAVADATNGTDVITRLNDLLAILRTHGIIDTA
jgi:hypothetical protein